MLLRFQFSNFRSFLAEQELSMVAGSNLADSDAGLLTASGIAEKAVPVAAIYGANASGKTNALRAIQFMSNAVRSSHRSWDPEGGIPRQAFGRQDGEPSRFVVDFALDGVRHQYGFVVDSKSVIEEWLYVYPRGKRQSWFQRTVEKRIAFSTKLPGENKTIEHLTRSNSLFLSAAAQNNHDALTPVYRWLTVGLQFEFGDVRGMRSYLTLDKVPNPTVIAKHLAAADYGITDFSVEQPDPATADLRSSVWKMVSALSEKSGKEFPPYSDAMDTKVRLVHRIGESDVPFELDDESNGTFAYLKLLLVSTRALQHGGVLGIDDLDSGLHPLLSLRLIRMFNDPAQNPKGAQLIFNTHDTNILRSGGLRRDEIWFTEKDQHGESHLYPLTDFKPRKNENLENGYLQGRYGAIPFIGPLDV